MIPNFFENTFQGSSANQVGYLWAYNHRMVSSTLSPKLEIEEKVVAELERLGVHYLSRLTNFSTHKIYSPAQFIADIVKQPSARVRNAVISLFLARPEYSAYVQEALRHSNAETALTLKFFYTAAVLLQEKYQINPTTVLPDFFLAEFGVTGRNPDEKLHSLGQKHQQVSGKSINWQGTYENAAKHLLHQWELEKAWNK